MNEVPEKLYLPRILLGIPALILIGIFVVIPYFEIILMSVRTPSTTSAYAPGFTTTNYIRILSDSLYLGLAGDTLWLAAFSTLVCLLLGYPVAYHLARTQTKWRSVLFAFVLSPLLIGVVVRCFGWIVLLSNNGVINEALGWLGIGPYRLMYNELGVLIVLVHVFLPFMILPIMNSIQNVDPRLEEAARTMGARQWKVFQKITLPLTLPGIQSGVIIVFVLSASAFVIPMLIGGGQVQTLTSLVVQQLMGTLLWPFGAALALVLSISMTVVIVVFVLVLRTRIRRLG